MTIRPTFLIGAERSGTTLFRLMVDSHPDITCIENLDYVINAVGDDGSYPVLDDYAKRLETETVYSTSGFTLDTSLPDLAVVANDFMTQRMHASGKSTVAVMAHDGMDAILRIWPDARFVHIVRDPRAVARSAKAFEWGTAVYFGIARWVDLMDEWERVTSTLEPGRFMEIRFEELVTDHVGVLTDVCQFIGMPYSDDMLSYADETDYDRPIPAKADEWRSLITDRETREVEARIGDRLKAKAYEPSGLAPIEVGSRDITIMKARVRVLKWRHKLEFFGLAGIGELIARKAGMNRLQVKLKKKMNAKERTGRKRSWREPGREYSYSPAKRAELASRR